MANTYGRQVVVPLTNKSGGGVIAGDVVVVGTANNDAFTTTTSVAFTGTIGIAQETIADNATGRVLMAGYAPLVNVTASVTRQNYGTTSSTVKKAVDAGATRTVGTFCQFLTGGTTPDAIIFNPDLGSASGSVATDAIWDAAGDLAVGTGANTAARLGIGSTGAYLYVASGTGAWGHPSGTIVQIVRAQSTADDTTTSGTLQASSLSASITPKYSDSIIACRVDGECTASRTAGTILERTQFVAIVNTTNSVTVVEQVRGVNLIATNAAGATAFSGIALYGEYTVNSTASRTFQLQHRSNNATNVTSTISGTRTGGIRMVLEEIRA